MLLRDHAPSQLRACRWLGRGGALTARTLSLGVLGFDGIVRTPLRLAPGRLPAADLPQAFGILAVTLVPTPRLVLSPTAFAQAQPRPRSSVGSLDYHDGGPRERSLPRDSPGRTRQRSPRALLNSACRRSLPNILRGRTRQGRKPLEKGAAKKTTINQTVKETVLEIHAGRIRRTTIAWLSSDARNWRCFFRSVPETKVFDDDHFKLANIESGIAQCMEYMNDHGVSESYLVVYNLCGGRLVFTDCDSVPPSIYVVPHGA